MSTKRKRKPDSNAEYTQGGGWKNVSPDLSDIVIPMNRSEEILYQKSFEQFSDHLPFPLGLEAKLHFSFISDDMKNTLKRTSTADLNPDNMQSSLFWASALHAHQKIVELTAEEKAVTEATWRDNIVIPLLTAVSPNNVLWVSENSITKPSEGGLRTIAAWTALKKSSGRIDGCFTLPNQAGIFVIAEYKKIQGTPTTTHETRKQAFFYAAAALSERILAYGAHKCHQIITILVEAQTISAYLLQNTQKDQIKYGKIFDCDLTTDGSIGKFCRLITNLPEFIQMEQEKCSKDEQNADEQDDDEQDDDQQDDDEQDDNQQADYDEDSDSEQPPRKIPKYSASNVNWQNRNVSESEDSAEEISSDMSGETKVAFNKALSINKYQSKNESKEKKSKHKKKKVAKSQQHEGESLSKPKKDDDPEGDNGPKNNPSTSSTAPSSQRSNNNKGSEKSNNNRGSSSRSESTKVRALYEEYTPPQLFFNSSRSGLFSCRSVIAYNVKAKKPTFNMEKYSDLDWKRSSDYGPTYTNLNGRILRCTASAGAKLQILLAMQDVFFIPEVLACWWECNIAKYVTEEYSANIPGLSLKQMIRQLLNAISLLHKECVVHNKISVNSVQWDGNTIKFVDWTDASKRGDEDTASCHMNEERNSPSYDLFCAGNVIHEWSKQLNDASFKYLADALIKPGTYRRIPIAKAIEAIDNPSVVEQWFKFVDISNLTFEKALKFCDELEINEFLTSQMPELFKTSTNSLKIPGCEWHEIDENHEVQYGTMNGAKIVGKCVRVNRMDWFFGREFFITKLLSGRLHMPTLLKYVIYKSKKDKYILMILPEYKAKPKTRNIKSFAQQLLAGIETMHKFGLIHCDIAPQNVMWDQNDDVVLIDFGSTYYANHVQYHQADMVPYGHEGFEPSDHWRYPATDIYSAGKLIEYYANKWGQMTNELNTIIKEMTCRYWDDRLTLPEAKEKLVSYSRE